MTFVSVPPEVLNITASLPFEIKSLIIKHFLLLFTKKLNHTEAYLSQLVTLFDYNPILDAIIGQVFEELVFDEGVFMHPNFKEIVQFVLSRSIPMKRLSLYILEDNEFVKVDASQNVLDFLQSFQVTDVSWACSGTPQDTLKYLRHTTSLTIDLGYVKSTDSLWSFEEFPRLANLELLEVTPRESCLDTVTQIMHNWRSFISSHWANGNKNGSLKLAIIAELQGNMNEYLISLTNLICNNKDIVTASIDILPVHTVPPLTKNLSLRLANQCNYVKVCNSGTSFEHLNVISWINQIICLKDLTITFHEKPDSSVILGYQNFHSLKRLKLSGFYMDALPFLNMIPDSLKSLDFKIEASQISTITLPSNLESLRVATNELPQISNVKDLRNLKKVYIGFLYGGLRMSLHDLERLQTSIDRLPSTVTWLKTGFIRNKTGKQLSFEKLPALKTLVISPCDLDSSTLISLRSLDIPGDQLSSIFRSSIVDSHDSKDPNKFATPGQDLMSSVLSKKLESLTVNMFEEIPNFWHGFILPLERLLELNLNRWSVSSNLTFDEYPPRLVSLSMELFLKKEGKLLLHGFDKTLKYMHLDAHGCITLKQERNNNTIIFSRDKLNEPFKEKVLDFPCSINVENAKVYVKYSSTLYVL
ncbi:unnamed protein product [Ambrosiozyma monospora]|uniref:Unnamed protein product n=1 Tax=Ambrosiozyma monospora TaxID=43982 RepID=A0ACB5T0W4_AMBMO|nr:unnamed protein product [Ambrosiozyma monospora]